MEFFKEKDSWNLYACTGVQDELFEFCKKHLRTEECKCLMITEMQYSDNFRNIIYVKNRTFLYLGSEHDIC